jgi:mitochondrial fission protein ELM1
MRSTLQVIRVLSDGRPGHENQTIGLAQALAARTSARVEVVRILGGPYPQRFFRAAAQSSGQPPPQLVVGAGHATHLPLLYAAWRFQARSVTVMKPTWPTRWFDLCLVPAHDSPRGYETPHLVRTRGALNRIPEMIPPKLPCGLILVGGPSAHYGWNESELAPAVKTVVAAQPQLEWTIGDSRRTPTGTLDRLRSMSLPARIVPWQKTTPDWLPAQLLAAEEAWVTEDSISMLHEAVTARARTGVLPTPVRRTRARVLNAVRGLVADGYATHYADWLSNGRTLAEPKPLHETSRCARLVLERFFNQP